MSDDEFNKLLAGPLDHPLVPFKITRLVLALRSVVDMTGEAGADALRFHCKGREDQDFDNAQMEGPDPGKCCVCGGTKEVRSVLQLPNKAPTPGFGWGCLVCDLPQDGAVAVLCDKCFDHYKVGDAKAHRLKWVCDGYPYLNKRVPVEELDPTPFVHDMAKHQNDEAGHGT